MTSTATPAPEDTPNKAHLQLPDLQEALLNASQLAAYLDELRSAGVRVEVSVKGSLRAQARTNVNPTSLFLDFIQERIHAAQLRYGYQGKRWIDTLMQTDQGVRLVRMES